MLGQNYGFRQYNLEEGLPQSQIGRIAEDRYGRLWLGSYYGGVSLFDGQSFQNFGTNEGLAEEDVIYVTTSADGRAFIATSAGITEYYAGNTQSFRLPNGLIPDMSVAGHGMEYADSTLWIATSQPGVLKWTYDTSYFITSENGFVNQNTTTIAKDEDGDLWFGTQKGWLYKKEGDQFVFKDSIPIRGRINSLTPDGYGRWFIAAETGVFLYQYGKISEWVPSIGRLDGQAIYRVALDNEGGTWVATDAGGVYFFERGAYYHFGEDEGLTDYMIADVVTDAQGNVWMGSNGAGLFKFGGRQFTYLTRQNGLESEGAYSMIEIGIDTYLLVTDAPGVQLYSQGKLTTLGPADGLPSETAITLYQDSAGNAWVGTGHGAALYDGTRFHPLPFPTAQFPGEHKVCYMAEDAQGSLWMCGHSWLARWDGNTLDRWKIPESMASHSIFTDVIRPLRNGQVLMGKDKHLLVFDPVTEAFDYFLPDFEPAHSVYYTIQIEEEADGTLWLALLNYGLVRYDGTEFKSYTIHDGLSSNQLYQMYADRYGNRWLGSEKGVDRVQIDEKGNLVSVKHYGVLEGFSGRETQANAVMEASNGTIWFGTVGGIMVYNPRYDRPVLKPPFVYLKGFELFFEKQEWTDFPGDRDSISGLPVELTLGYKQNHISFYFAAVDLRLPEKVEYRHRLLPDQEEWSPPLSEGRAVLGNLTPGTYTFEVIASNHSGIWNAEQDALRYTFTITPPYWQTTLFYILVGLGIVICLGLIIRIRINQTNRIRRLLEEMVTERTEELNQKNRKLAETGEELKTALDDVAAKNHAITQSIQYARRIQEAVFPSSETIKSFFPDSFLMYRPKDIVSGDFFWIAHRQDFSVMAVADCTGHGVPGAFMSMIGNTALNQIVKENRVFDPGEILDRLRHHVITSLQLDSDGLRRTDGMDVAIISYNHQKDRLYFAGAKRALYKVREGTLIEHKGNFEPIGYLGDVPFDRYQTMAIDWQPGDMLYLTTDGYADQFGGPDGKKVMVKNFKNQLASLAALSPEKQLQVLENDLELWKGQLAQTDDILITGIRHPNS